MSLTYDQKSEIRLAFDEAFVSAERRRSARISYQVAAQISEFKKDAAGEPFTVQIEDFSPTGVGMLHDTALPPGSQYLLKVPREKWGELIVLMTAVRCEARDDGKFQIGLELSSVMDRTELGKFVDALHEKRHTSRLTRLLFLTFGVFGLALALLIN